MQIVLSATVTVVGFLWLIWPQNAMLVPGALMLDDRVIREFGLSASASEQIRNAGGFPAPYDLVRSRLFGLLFVTIGLAGFIVHTDAVVLLAETAVAIYAFIVFSAAETRDTKTGARNQDVLPDRALICLVLIAVGNAAILAAIPHIQARMLALVVAMLIPALGYVHWALRPAAIALQLQNVLKARQRCGMEIVAISMANFTAFAYGTLGPQDDFTLALRGWAIVALAATLYYTRSRFTSLNDDLKTALHAN